MLVEIMTEDGSTGWGEAFGPPELTAPVVAWLAPLLELDRSPHQVRDALLETPIPVRQVRVPEGPGSASRRTGLCWSGSAPDRGGQDPARGRRINPS
jgi:hypothetical protein